MKKNIYNIWGILLIFSFSSCNLDTNPRDSVNVDIVLNNATNAEKILNGAWAYLMDASFSDQNPGWSCLTLTSDAMGNDVAVQFDGDEGYYKHYSFVNVSNNNSATVKSIWTLAYKVIDNTNVLINRIDGVPGNNELKIRIKAQAYALRGYIYLNLATFFADSYAYNPTALCVPISLEASSSSTVGNKRESVEAVYKRAEEDLVIAYNTIGNYTRDEKHKIDKNVIAGILSRLYSQKNDWESAQRYAEEAHKNYTWMSKNDYLSGFNDRANNEWIWGHGQTSHQSVASKIFNFLDVSSSSSLYYSFMADPHFKDLFDPNDIRSSLFEWDVKRNKGGLMYKKFAFRSDRSADIVLMRKAELVLTEAESYAELGQLSKAIEKLNELRVQRGADTPNLSTLSKSELIEEILKERRKELFGEGFALYDIKRRQKSVERSAATGLVPGTNISIKGHTILGFPTNNETNSEFKVHSKYYIFTIPDSEVTNNPNL